MQTKKKKKGRILHPLTDEARGFSEKSAEVNLKLSELEAIHRKMKLRGLKVDHPKRVAIQAEIDANQKWRRIWGLIDSHGGVWFFDRYAGDRVIRWIETYCTHKKGKWAGQKLILAGWQRKIIRQLFGWKRADGFRRFSEVWLEVARKNGKSILAAAIGLYLAVGDREAAAEVYFIAGSRDQAERLAFRDAKSMIDRSTDLSDQIDVAKYVFAHGRSESIAEVLGGKNQHGLNPSGAIGDEVHEWKGRDQYEAITTADGTRDQPMFVFITTAGHDIQSLGGELHRRAISVRDGHSYQPHLYVKIYALDAKDDWHDPKNWGKANPGLSYGAPKLEVLINSYRSALGRPAEENSFKRLKLNMWTDTHSAWIPGDVWNACAAEIDFGRLRGAQCYLGLDLARVHDLSALALWFPPGNPLFPHMWILASRFWCPQEDIKAREKADGVRYGEWVERGLLNATPGNAIDFNSIEADILSIAKMFDVQQLGYDPLKAQQLMTNLANAGLPCIEVTQTMTVLAPPTGELDRMATAGEMVHGAQEIMDWNVANTVVQHNSNGDYRPHKAKSAERIDGAVAAVIGLATAMGEEHKAPLSDFLSAPIRA